MKAGPYHHSGNPDVFPVFKSTCLLRSASERLPAPLDGENVRFFAYARAALAAGLDLLGLKPGDNVLVPSLMCDVVMAPFVDLSIEPRFYNLDENLGPDLDDARTLLDGQTRALMAVNYFGFAPDFERIRCFCDKHGLFFVEDNAHGFLSRRGERPLGTFGDIAIESFRKILGLLDGAALIVNAPMLDCARLPVDKTEPPLSPALNLSRSILASIKVHTGIDALAPAGRFYYKMGAGKPAVATNGAGPRSEEISLLNRRQRWSGLSEAVVRRIRPEEIVNRHREGFRSWLRWFASDGEACGRPLFEELAPGIVPLAFPVVGRGYDRMEDFLKQFNIGWNKWPAFLPHSSPGWRFFDRVLLLPVHCRLPLPNGG